MGTGAGEPHQPPSGKGTPRHCLGCPAAAQVRAAAHGARGWGGGAEWAMGGLALLTVRPALCPPGPPGDSATFQGSWGPRGGRLGHGSWVLGPRRPHGARTPAGCQGRSGYWRPSVFAKILLESHLLSFFPSHRSPASLVTVTSAPEAIRLAAPGGPEGWTCFLKVKQSQQECTQVGRGPDRG